MLILFKEHKLLLAASLFVAFLSSFISVGISFVLEKILTAVTTQNWRLFNTMLIIVPIYLLTAGVLVMIDQTLANRLIVKTVKDMRSQSYKGIFSRDPEGFQAVNTADYISALTNDVKTIEENLLIPFIQSIQYVFIFLITGAALFYYSPIIAGMMLVCLIVMYLVPAAFGKAIGKNQERLSSSFAMFTARLKDQLAGFDVIRSFRLTDNVSRSYDESNSALAEAKYSVDRLASVSLGISQILGSGIQLLIMLVSGYMVLNGNMTAGVLLALLNLSGSFVQPVAVIMQNISIIQGVKPVLNRLLSFCEKQPTAFVGTEPPAYQEALQFQHVNFSYNPEQPVLKDVNIVFEKNKKYAIIGASGCGKSTLIKLLSANYGGFDGQIMMDGKDIRTLQLDELLTRMSVIHQNIYMFDESIEENISLHRPYDVKEWDRAVRISGVDRFLPQMENGSKTRVGENGINLSGGQRQRIAVARAILHEKPILILDEGTSAVDMQTAYDIESSLLHIPDLTMITITHNLDPRLLRRYDAIICMEDGRIAEMGEYDSLHNLQLHVEAT